MMNTEHNVLKSKFYLTRWPIYSRYL